MVTRLYLLLSLFFGALPSAANAYDPCPNNEDLKQIASSTDVAFGYNFLSAKIGITWTVSSVEVSEHFKERIWVWANDCRSRLEKYFAREGIYSRLFGKVDSNFINELQKAFFEHFPLHKPIKCEVVHKSDETILIDKHIFGHEYIVGNRLIPFSFSITDALPLKNGEIILAKDIVKWDVVKFSLDSSDMSPQSDAVFRYEARSPIVNGNIIQSLGDIQVVKGGIRNENYVLSNKTGTFGAELVGILRILISYRKSHCE